MAAKSQSSYRPAHLIEGQALPPVLKGDLSSLSPSARKRLAKLVGPRPLVFVATALANWLIIAVIISLAVRLDAWWSYILAPILIAGRQQVFGLLMHDQTHYLGWKSKWGDMFANTFVAWPIGVSLEKYGAIHLSHHQYFFTEKDPDYSRKNGPEWTFLCPGADSVGYFCEI